MISAVASVSMPAQAENSVTVLGTHDPNAEGIATGFFDILFSPIVAVSPAQELQPPEVMPSPDGTTTDPTSPNFDYRTIPRLTPRPEPVHVLTLAGVKLTVYRPNGQPVDLSDYVEEWRVEIPLKGTWFASVDLIRSGNVDLCPLTNTGLWRLGNRVDFSLRMPGGGEFKICKGMKLCETPSFKTLKGGGQRSTIYFGDWFRYLQNRPNNKPQLNCQPQPKTAGELASRYYSEWTGEAYRFPNGADLIEPVDDPTDQKQAYRVIADLLGATSLYLRTSPNNTPVVGPRPRYIAGNATRLNLDDMLEPPEFSARGQLHYSSVTGYSRGTLLSPPERTTDRYQNYPVGYTDLDKRPYIFNGLGWYEDIYEVRLGGELVYKRTDLYGYYPANPTVNTTREGACQSSGFWNEFNTEFGLIHTITEGLKAAKHPSGQYLVRQQERRKIGFTWLSTGEGEHVRYPEQGTAALEATIETLENVELPNDKICRAEWTHVINVREKNRYAIIDAELGFELVEAEADINYNTLSSSELGSGKGWYQLSQRGKWSDTYDRFLWEPATIGPIQPPESRWIGYVSTQIEIEAEAESEVIANKYGDSYAGQVQMPFVYTAENARRYLDTWLREQNGLHGEILIQLPWTAYCQPGHSFEVEVVPDRYGTYIADRLLLAGDGRSADLAVSLHEEIAA